MLDHDRIQLSTKIHAFVKLTDSCKLHVYIPGVIDCYMSRFQSKWIFDDYSRHLDLFSLPVSEAYFYQQIDKYADHQLRNLINKEMLR